MDSSNLPYLSFHIQQFWRINLFSLGSNRCWYTSFSKWNSSLILTKWTTAAKISVYLLYIYIYIWRKEFYWPYHSFPVPSTFHYRSLRPHLLNVGTLLPLHRGKMKAKPLRCHSCWDVYQWKTLSLNCPLSLLCIGTFSY